MFVLKRPIKRFKAAITQQSHGRPGVGQLLHTGHTHICASRQYTGAVTNVFHRTYCTVFKCKKKKMNKKIKYIEIKNKNSNV